MCVYPLSDIETYKLKVKYTTVMYKGRSRRFTDGASFVLELFVKYVVECQMLYDISWMVE